MKNEWNELSIANDFLFGKIMRKPEICKKMLETILEVEIDHLEYPESQKVIDLSKDARSVRLDIYVKDKSQTVYNIEVQTIDTGEIPKRSRYYQGMIDLNLIEKGEHYKNLNKSYVIFICTFDLFQKGRHLYIFENRCRQENDLVLGDDTIKIFLNTDSTRNDVSEDLKAFLDYVAGKTAHTNIFVEELEKEVTKAKENQEWRREYMTLLMRDQENIEKGLAKGRAEGLAEGRVEERKKFICNLLKQGFSEEQILKLCDTSQKEIEALKQELQ